MPSAAAPHAGPSEAPAPPKETPRPVAAPPAAALPRPEPAAARPAPPPRVLAPPAAPLREWKAGDVVGSGLQLIRPLGEGGFGVVYLVASLETREIYALKTIRDELLRDEGSREMFRKEAQIWIDLGRHPYLVRAHSVDEVHGRLVLLMEFVAPDGAGLNSLEGHLARRAPGLPQALRWAIEFCYGMEHAYARGVRCHRDIKPANVLIGRDGHVRISDFGIAGLTPTDPKRLAAVIGGGETSQTQAGTAFGTPTHMPPEQFLDAASCDERSDVYAFGVVLFQLASRGKLPFVPPPPAPGPDRMHRYWLAFGRLHAEAEPRRLPSPLFPIVERCLRKSRTDRYPGFAALRADLEALLLAESGQRAAAPRLTGLEAWELSNQGNSLGSLDRWPEALACYERALSQDPGSAPIHNNRGNALAQLGRVEEAMECFERAIQLDPLYASPWANLGLAHARAGRDEPALAAFTRALELDPRDVDSWIGQAVVLGRLGRLDEELAALDRAIEIDPREPTALLNRGLVLQRAGRLDEALGLFDRCLASDPRRAKAWGAKGVVLTDLGRPAEAVACFDEALAIDASDAQPFYNRGNALAALGRFAEAREGYARAAQLAPRFALSHYNLGLSELRLGRPAEAAAALREFLARASQDDPLRAGAEGLLETLGHGGSPQLSATPVFEETRSEDGRPLVARPAVAPRESAGPTALAAAPAASTSTTPPAAVGPAPRRAALEEDEEPEAAPLPSGPTLADWNDRCQEHFGAGRFAEALECAEKALDLDPRNPTSLNNRANCLFKMERGEEALGIHDRLLEIAPAFLGSWLNKGFMEDALGREDQALRTLLDFLELQQAAGQRDAQTRLARNKVDELTAKGVRPAPRGALGWLAFGYQAMVRRETDQALTLLDRAIAAAPANAALWGWKGDALATVGRPDEAIAAYDAGLRHRPGDPELHHARGLAHQKAGRNEEAVQAFDTAIAADPKHAASWSDRGKTLGLLKKVDEAIASLARAAELQPRAAAPWQNRAMIEDGLGREAEALASYRAFLARAGEGMRLQVEHAKARVAVLRARVRAAAAAERPASAPPELATEPDASETAPAAPPVPAAEAESPVEQAGPAPAAPEPGAPEAEPAAGAAETAPVLAHPEPAAEPVVAAASESGPEAPVVEALGSVAAVAEAPAPLPVAEQEAAPAPPQPGVTEPAETPPPSAPEASAAVAAAPAAPAAPRPEKPAGAPAGAREPIPEAPVPRAEPSADAEECLRQGETLLNLGQYEKALDWLDQAIAADPDSPKAWAAKGEALRKLKRFAEAVGHVKRALAINPTHALTWQKLGSTFEGMGRYEEAIDAWDKGLEIAPGEKTLWNGRGLSFFYLKHDALALADFDRALALDPRFSLARFNKAIVEDRLGRHEDAARSFQQFLSVAPPHLTGLIQKARERLKALRR